MNKHARAGAIMTIAECWELGSCLLLKYWNMTQNLNQNNLENVMRIFGYAQFESDFYFVLTLLLHRFLSKHMAVFASFP